MDLELFSMVMPNYKHKQPGTIDHTRLIVVGDKGMLLSIFEIIVIKFTPFIGKNAVTLCMFYAIGNPIQFNRI
jgi:hypothetical protein